MKDTVEEWKKKLNLTDWVVYLIQAEKKDMKNAWGLNVNADNMYNEKMKVAFIRYVEISERSIIHELLHIAFPLESETKIEKRTIQIIKSLKK